MPGYSPGCHQFAKSPNNIRGTDAASCPDGQALPSVRLGGGQQPHRPPIPGPGLDEVTGPHMVSPLRSQPDARSVVQPQPSSPGLPGRHFKPLPPPHPLRPLVVHIPPGTSQQGGNPPVAVPAEPGGQPHNAVGQGLRRPGPTARGDESSGVVPAPCRPAAPIPQS